jgi:hypothetical protein
MEQPSRAKTQIWKWLGFGIAIAVVVFLVADEVRVRLENRKSDQRWMADVGQLASTATRMPAIELETPLARAHAIGDVFDVRSNGAETVFMSLKDIDRVGRTYREDAKHIFKMYFSQPPWRDASFAFAAEHRSAIVRAVTSDAAGATHHWMIEFKRLGSRVVFVYLHKGQTDKSFTEFSVARITQHLHGVSDDPGGATYVECAMCGHQVLEVDHKNFPLIWAVMDRESWQPLPRETASGDLAPVCNGCASSLPADYVRRMKP